MAMQENIGKLTKTTVEKLHHTTADFIFWDTEIKGFGVKVFSTGAKSFFYQYRNENGKLRRFTIGKLSDTLTTDQARKKAKDLAFEVHAGRDPMGEKQARRQAITVNELFDLYVVSERFMENAQSTQAVDKGRIDRHLRPLLGREIADKVTADQIVKAQRAIREGKTAVRVKTKARGLAKVTGGEGTAAKCVLLLKVAYSWAIKNKLLKNNPAAGLKVAPTGTRETIMAGAAEYARLFETLERMENEKRIRSAAADAIRFIALTGARRGEVTGLIWQWVDLASGQVTLPREAHKAGRKTGKPRIIALPAEAQAIVARQPGGEAADYVFLPSKGEGALSLGKIWMAVRAEAKLPAGLGLHGLRHSIGTHLAMAGASAVELMETLGHRQISTTLRYIHFNERARSTLAERAASVAMAGLTGKTKKATVTKMRGAK